MKPALNGGTLLWALLAAVLLGLANWLDGHADGMFNGPGKPGPPDETIDAWLPATPVPCRHHQP